MKNYIKTYNFLFKYGLKQKTNFQTISLSLYGSINDATRCPQIIICNLYKILPQPYPPRKPGNKGWRVLQLNWFVEFVRSIEQIKLKYFGTIHPNQKNQKQFYIS